MLNYLQMCNDDFTFRVSAETSELIFLTSMKDFERESRDYDTIDLVSKLARTVAGQGEGEG